MKSATALIIILFIVSCKQKEIAIDYTSFKEKKIALALLETSYQQKDTIATITLKIPERLDTFYQWHQESDCTSCGWLQYRFANKKYSQFAESGWIWTYKPDSVYQFSIKHRPLKETPDSIINRQLTEKDSSQIMHLASLIAYGNIPSYLEKKVMEIDNRKFWITSFLTPSGYLTWDTTLYLCAITNLKRNTLYFIGECGAKDTSGFTENMYKTIKSVQIVER